MNILIGTCHYIKIAQSGHFFKETDMPRMKPIVTAGHDYLLVLRLLIRDNMVIPGKFLQESLFNNLIFHSIRSAKHALLMVVTSLIYNPRA